MKNFKSNGKVSKPSKSKSNGNNGSQSAPVAKATKKKMPRAKMVSLPSGSFRIRHKEYVQDVAGSVSFAVTSLPINPGVPSVFPWLSSIANRYESYIFHKLDFSLETQAPTSSIGTVMQVVDYDVTDNPPANKAALLAYKDAERSAPWQDSCFHCAASDLQKLKTRYTRMAGPPSGTDQRLYDVGQLLIGTQGQAGTEAISELYAEYDIELLTPQLSFDCSSVLLVPTTTVMKSNLLGDAPVFTGVNNPFDTSQTFGNTFVFATGGEYIIYFLFAGTGMNAGFPTPTGTAENSVLTSSEVTSGTTVKTVGYRVRAAHNDTVIIDGSGFTTVASGRIWVSSYAFDNTD